MMPAVPSAVPTLDSRLRPGATGAGRRLRTLPGALCLLVVGLLALGPLGCGEAEGPPVASLRVEPREVDLPHGSFRDVRFDWRLTSELEGATEPVLVFVHLLDEQKRLTRTFDHPMPGGWAAGEERTVPVRLHQSILAPPLPPGDYTLSVGVYDGAGNRWPIDVEGERVAEKEYAVARVTVPATPGPAPSLGFTPSWSPTQAGTDRQILALRWLTGDGAIRLEDLEEPGVLWLRLRIPPDGVDGTRRIFRPGGEEEAREHAAGVRVISSCSGFEAFVSGDGAHGVEVPVTPDDAGCVVRLVPNYAMVAQGLEQQTFLLENIAWKAKE